SSGSATGGGRDREGWKEWNENGVSCGEVWRRLWRSVVGVDGVEVGGDGGGDGVVVGQEEGGVAGVMSMKELEKVEE
ncbi:hypothetical protein, partial [Agrococcus jejuensis]|uniref:hypothetical protein n=1 Tax=Agrococcus jejuensis TaxID=399736 RepID=UPI001C93129C